MRIWKLVEQIKHIIIKCIYFCFLGSRIVDKWTALCLEPIKQLCIEELRQLKAVKVIHKMVIKELKNQDTDNHKHNIRNNEQLQIVRSKTQQGQKRIKCRRYELCNEASMGLENIVKPYIAKTKLRYCVISKRILQILYVFL